MMLGYILVVAGCVSAARGMAVQPDSECANPDPEAVDAMCRGCDMTRNPLMYFPAPCGCGFLQCRKDMYGQWEVVARPCPACTCYKPSAMTCQRVNDADCPSTADISNQEATVSDTQCTVVGRTNNVVYVQTKALVPGDPGSYELVHNQYRYRMPCPPGTWFNIQLCDCAIGGDAWDIPPITCLDFSSSTFGGPIYIDASHVTVEKDDLKGKVAYFNGLDSSLEIPYFTNREAPQLVISVWIKPLGGDTEQVLFTNQDCNSRAGEPSIDIRLSPNMTLSAGFRTENSDAIDAYEDIPIKLGAWTNVILMYDGASIKLFINGKQQAPAVPASGQILPSRCPLLIGSSYNKDYYHGYMFMVCLYDRALPLADIMEIYESDRQEDDSGNSDYHDQNTHFVTIPQEDDNNNTDYFNAPA